MTARPWPPCCWTRGGFRLDSVRRRRGGGYREALEAFERQWQGTCKLEPQLKELHIASVAADTAVLVTPLLLTLGKPGAAAATVAVSWGGVFVRTRSGWRLASISHHAAPGTGTAPGGG